MKDNMNTDQFAELLQHCLTEGNYKLHESGNVCFWTDTGEIIYEGSPRVHPVIESLCLKIFGSLDPFSFLPKEG